MTRQCFRHVYLVNPNGDSTTIGEPGVVAQFRRGLTPSKCPGVWPAVLKIDGKEIALEQQPTDDILSFLYILVDFTSLILT